MRSLGPRSFDRARSRRAFTLIEVAISASLLALLLGSVAMVTMTSTGAQKRSSLETRVQTQARRAVDRVVDELTNAGAGVLFPDPGAFGTSDLVFQVVTGAPGGVAAWSLPRRLRLRFEPGELDNGLDDDGDGLIDEGMLELVIDEGGPEERTIVLCRGVSELAEGELPNGADDDGNGLVDEPGFFITREEGVLNVSLSVQRADSEGRIATATVRTGVRLRN